MTPTGDTPPSGTHSRALPALTGIGQGTWGMGERAQAAKTEIHALQRGIDLGMTLIDTAEMYGDGGAERIVAEAIAGRCAEVFVVSKVLPGHADLRGTIAACEASLRRLRIDCIDLYLLHWRGSVPLADTLDAFDRLRQQGKIAHWGVSNFDPSDMDALRRAGGDAVATNQVLYNLTRRGIEYDLLPQSQRAGLPIMAYSPIEQGRVLRHPALLAVAQRHSATPAQIALAWVLRQPGVMAIPKAASLAHVDENAGARAVRLTAEDLAALDRAFAPPKRAVPLEML